MLFTQGVQNDILLFFSSNFPKHITETFLYFVFNFRNFLKFLILILDHRSKIYRKNNNIFNILYGIFFIDNTTVMS